MPATTPPTRFASAERAQASEIQQDNQIIASDPRIRQLLDSFPEAALILNRQRQIVMVNDKLLALLNKPEGSILGRRPGEAVNCIHWGKEPGGCGTTDFCRWCGAVGAILTSQESTEATSRECTITTATPDGERSLDLLVWATPLSLHREFTVFAIRDIASEKRRDVLERMFFHDILNVAGSLLGLMEEWPNLSYEEAQQLSRTAGNLARELVEQIQAARDLTAAERGDLGVILIEVDAGSLLWDLLRSYCHHHAAEGRTIAAPRVEGSGKIRTDPVLLRRVLGNLITNALEASELGQTVDLAFRDSGTADFSVHNHSAIPDGVKQQVFQRSFTTKAGPGRGVGTYSVKLLTEQFLGGTVGFTTSEEDGTTFTVRLPQLSE